MDSTETHHGKTIDEKRAYSRAYYASHKTQCRGYFKKWASKNPDWKKNHPTYKRDWERKQSLNPEYREKKHIYNHLYSHLHPEPRGKPRSNKKARAQNQAKRIPILKLCEVCPEDDIRKAVHRHHPDYDYPKIFVSCCDSCHKYIHAELNLIVN